MGGSSNQMILPIFSHFSISSCCSIDCGVLKQSKEDKEDADACPQVNCLQLNSMSSGFLGKRISVSFCIWMSIISTLLQFCLAAVGKLTDEGVHCGSVIFILRFVSRLFCILRLESYESKQSIGDIVFALPPISRQHTLSYSCIDLI